MSYCGWTPNNAFFCFPNPWLKNLSQFNLEAGLENIYWYGGMGELEGLVWGIAKGYMYNIHNTIIGNQKTREAQKKYPLLNPIGSPFPLLGKNKPY